MASKERLVLFTLDTIADAQVSKRLLSIAEGENPRSIELKLQGFIG